MISSCDLVVAAPSARFSTPGAAVGLFCHTPGIPLARRVPRAVSGYMLLTGETISAEEAYNAGLVSKLVQEDKMDEEVERICAAIGSKPRGVIALGKRFYQHQVCTTAYHTKLDRTIPYCAIPYHTMPYHTIPYRNY